jgi:hypothetical protein
MKLPYTSLAIAGLSAMITTLLITSTARYAPQHPRRPMADANPLPTYRCNQATNASIIHALTTGP